MLLQNLFNPKSIALVGASNTTSKLGNYLAKNLLQSQFGGNLYFLNPKKEQILGISSIQNPIEIKELVDLWVIAIPAKFVLESIQQIGQQIMHQKSTRTSFVCLISAGYKEIGAEGLELENQLLELSDKHGFRLIGPNCLGLINNQSDSKLQFNASFATAPKTSGGISLVSQSGAVISAVVDKLESQGIGFNKIISLGNQADLQAQDFLEYLITDKETKVIALYLEGFENGSKFVDIAKKSTKPIVILKAGNSSISQETISSHTGSIAGNYEVAKAYLQEASCIWVENLEELQNSLIIFSKWSYF